MWQTTGYLYLPVLSLWFLYYFGITFYIPHEMYRDLRQSVSLHKNNIKFISTSSARSPLYSHISTAIRGLPSIRAFHKEENVLNKFHYFQNEHTKAWYTKIVASRWFGIRIDLIGSSFLAMIAFISIPLANSKYSLIYTYNHRYTVDLL